MQVSEEASGRRGPLAGIRVLEFTHLVMGPCCGMVLADLGADVIKVEPAPAGDTTRRLTGAATGFFPTYNRNKRSLSVDVKRPEGLELVHRLLSSSDVLIENFRPGTMEKLGLGVEVATALNPRLVYCACKGFLPGPYEHRTALDEVVQMMGGLAYMTGPPGRPLRTGASVNDILGGVFGAIAILAALRDRDATGRGGLVQSGLFETNMLLVAQHMAYKAIEGSELPSFGDPAMGRPWPLYDVFESADADSPVFVGVVSTAQWRDFCDAFNLRDLLADPALATMPQLAAARSRILPLAAAVFRSIPQREIMRRCENIGLPFSPISRPAQMFDDPHLKASGGLLSTDFTAVQNATSGAPAMKVAGLPALPISMPAGRLPLWRQPPRIGEHSYEIAREMGLSEATIAAFVTDGTLAAPGTDGGQSNLSKTSRSDLATDSTGSSSG